MGGEAAGNWTSIGKIDSNTVNVIRGTFDGGRYAVSGLYINSKEDYQGLFSSLGAGGTIKNLSVSGTVTGASYVGGMVGNAVSQAVPTVSTLPTAQRVRRGNLLSASSLTGGVMTGADGQPLEGAWKWRKDREMEETGTFEEIVVFTPPDSNYTPVEEKVSVTVYRPSSGGAVQHIIPSPLTPRGEAGLTASV